MTSRDFCFWLQGFFELAFTGPMPPEPYGGKFLNSDQTELVKRHLALVFKHDVKMEHPVDLQPYTSVGTLAQAQAGSIASLTSQQLARC